MVCLLSISTLYGPHVYKFMLTHSKKLTEHCLRERGNKVLLECRPYHGVRPQITSWIKKTGLFIGLFDFYWVIKVKRD